MADTDALFEVQGVFHVEGHVDTLVSGRIRGGAIRSGMQAKLVFTHGLFIYARIRSVENATGAHGTSQVELVVETSKEDAGRPWQGLCPAGTVITVEDMAHRKREPAIPPSLRRPATMMKIFLWVAVGLAVASVFAPGLMDLGPNGLASRRRVSLFFLAAILGSIALMFVSARVAVTRARRAAQEAARNLSLGLPPFPNPQRDSASALDTPEANRD